MNLHIARITVDSDDAFILPLELGQCQHSGRNFFKCWYFLRIRALSVIARHVRKRPQGSNSFS